MNREIGVCSSVPPEQRGVATFQQNRQPSRRLVRPTSALFAFPCDHRFRVTVLAVNAAGKHQLVAVSASN